MYPINIQSYLSLKKNIFSTFLTQAPVLVISIITGIIITRTIGAEGKGIYAVFQSNIELFTLFFGLNINMGLSYFVSKKKIPFEKIIGLGIIGSVIGWLFFLCFLFPIYYSSSTSLFFPENFNSSFYLIYLISTFFLNSINIFISSLFVGLKKFNIINKLALFNSTFNILAYGFLYFSIDIQGSQNLGWIFCIATLTLLINTIIWITFYLKLIGKKPEFKLGKKFFIIFFSFVITGYFSNLINLLNYRLDIWVINNYMTLKDVGLYSLAVNIGQMLWMITIPIVLVLQPYLNSPDESDKQEKFTLFSRLNFTTVTILGVIIFAIGRFLVPIVYGKEFTESIAALNILIVGIIFSAATKLFAIVIINAQKVKYNLYATIAGLITTLILDFTLIPKFGIVGASTASTFTYIVIFVSVFYFLHKKIKYPLKNYFFLTLKDVKKLKDL